LTLVVIIAIAVILALVTFRLDRIDRGDPKVVVAAIENFNIAALTSLLDTKESDFLRERLGTLQYWHIHALRMAAAMQYLREIDMQIKSLAASLGHELTRNHAGIRRQLPYIRWMIFRLQVRAAMSMILPGIHMPARRLYDMHEALMSALRDESSGIESLS
jgi:hypothetical protein